MLRLSGQCRVGELTSSRALIVIFDDGIKRPMVFGWMPAIAIYFHDPDGHSLEFIAMLPQPALGVGTWDEWQRLHKW
jgi:hypothetical protein